MQQKAKRRLNIGIGLLVAIVYFIVPTDFIPDVIPALGWIDDIVAILLAIANAIRFVKIHKE